MKIIGFLCTNIYMQMHTIQPRAPWDRHGRQDLVENHPMDNAKQAFYKVCVQIDEPSKEGALWTLTIFNRAQYTSTRPRCFSYLLKSSRVDGEREAEPKDGGTDPLASSRVGQGPGAFDRKSLMSMSRGSSIGSASTTFGSNTTQDASQESSFRSVCSMGALG